MTKEEMKNRISLALKDPNLQQGFEIICKENAELEKALSVSNASNSFYKIQLTKAKEIIREYIRINLLPPIERNFDDEVKLFEQAEQFLKEVSE